jgi:hypothetical protein
VLHTTVVHPLWALTLALSSLLASLLWPSCSSVSTCFIPPSSPTELLLLVSSISVARETCPHGTITDAQREIRWRL